MTESNIYCSEHEQNEDLLDNNLFFIAGDRIAVNNHVSRFTFRYSFAGHQHFEIEGYQRTIQPNSILFLENGQTFNTDTFTGSNVELMTVAFNPIFFLGTLELVANSHEELLNSPITDISTRATTYFQNLNYDLKYQLLELKELISNPVFEDVFETKLESLILELFHLKKKQNKCALQSINSIKYSTKKEILKRLTIGKDYLISNLQYQISIDRICEEVGMSKYHFIRTFKMLFGVSPHQYLKRARINFSEELLKNTKLEIAEIATKSGYESPSAFSRVFKELIHTSPIAYRKLAISA
ncbi:MAG: helix-turn-helix transcriptional regulator [Cytophagales bacterium]|nr:helix-turn-helix transcriptional regulator [Cytophagales bacterium]